ncbi:hypothetical protein BDR26DRAFT_1013016 [Obelidium mucronatum]|nr:hypothetical protein BDR26DRAFT_1013016 [Obelidium mucronatum]
MDSEISTVGDSAAPHWSSPFSKLKFQSIFPQQQLEYITVQLASASIVSAVHQTYGGLTIMVLPASDSNWGAGFNDWGIRRLRDALVKEYRTSFAGGNWTAEDSDGLLPAQNYEKLKEKIVQRTP